jgi:hypothetical protein
MANIWLEVSFEMALLIACFTAIVMDKAKQFIPGKYRLPATLTRVKIYYSCVTADM